MMMMMMIIKEEEGGNHQDESKKNSREVELHVRDVTIMPEGWGRHLDNDGNKYYVNPQGKSQWERPKGSIPPPKEPCPFSHPLIPEQIMQLAAGWEAHRDESGNVFFLDTRTGNVQWERPAK